MAISVDALSVGEMTKAAGPSTVKMSSATCAVIDSRSILFNRESVYGIARLTCVRDLQDYACIMKITDLTRGWF